MLKILIVLKINAYIEQCLNIYIYVKIRTGYEQFEDQIVSKLRTKKKYWLL